MENTHCIVCSCKESSPLLTLSDRLTQSSEKFILMQCMCGFVYLNPRPTVKEIYKYYKSENYDPHVKYSTKSWDKLYNYVQQLTFRWKYNILKGHSGKKASINGATQIRAGVIRPEVIITLPEQSDIHQDFNEDDLIIKEGSQVRVIREPYFGQIGIVKELPSEPIKIDSETKARVAEIEFKNNERKLVPRANLEIILE